MNQVAMFGAPSPPAPRLRVVAHTPKLQAPFPWFGGKSRVAPEVWERFGDVKNYVEPFFGSGAVLLGRPGGASGIETINDLDGFVANFWRAVRSDPDACAEWAGDPVNENDLHARHSWLVARREDLSARLNGDPEFFDAKIAGWWVWGLCSWIGSGFCSGRGPWVVDDSGALVDRRKLPRLGDAGMGVNRQLPRLDGLGGCGVSRIGGSVAEWFAELRDRMARVRVASGDWARVCGPSVTRSSGVAGVFLDPPYSGESDGLYSSASDVSPAVRAWAIENGENPKMRIALCGYEGEHEMPESWSAHAWKSAGGFAGQSASHDNPNARRERIWFSPHCLPGDS